MGGSKAKEPPETSQERAAAEVALQRYQRYMQVYRPLENAAISDVMGQRSGDRIERVAAGRLNADAAQTMAAAAPGSASDPSGQMSQGRVMDTQRAAIIANAAAEGAGLGRKQRLMGLDAAIGIGTGQAKQAQLSFNDLAGQSLEGAIRRQESAYNQRVSNSNMMGSAIGAAGAIGKDMYSDKK